MGFLRPNAGEAKRTEHLLWVFASGTFLVFFQAYMVAPIIPRLAQVLGTSPHMAGLLAPAYLIPYGMMTLFYGLWADRVGARPIMVGSLVAFVVLTFMTATARSIDQLMLWRALTGFGAGGFVPLALMLVGKLYPYEQRGRPLGLLFGAMAGGMAAGSTFGAVLEPMLGWRGLFGSVSLIGAAVVILLLPYRGMMPVKTGPRGHGDAQAFLRGYANLLGNRRAFRTYLYVFGNGVFHSGVFTWLGLYFDQRFGLGPVGIGLALLGYGIPGFLLGLIIGRAADRWGRA